MSAPVYLRIGVNTPAQRLAYLRTKAAAKGVTWREERAWSLNSWEVAYGKLAEGKQGESVIYYTHVQVPYFRNERDCNKVRGCIDHEGWYTDGNYSGIVVGIVGGLSHGRFIAGYRWENGERVWWPVVYEDDQDAAKAADLHAERFAELCRDDDEKFQARVRCEGDIEDGLTDLMALRPKLWLSIAARENAGACQQTKDYAQGFNNELRETARKIVEKIRDLRTELSTMPEM